MKKLESKLNEVRVVATIDECSIVGTILTEGKKLVSESGIVLENGGHTIVIPLLRASEFIKELQSITNEMTGMVQRTTHVREHEVGAFTVAGHDRKIPLGRKDIAVGSHPHEKPHCAPEPVDEKHTATGSKRKRTRNLTYNEVAEIRKLHKGGASVTELCDAYSALPNVMRNIVAKRTYTKVK